MNELAFSKKVLPHKNEVIEEFKQSDSTNLTEIYVAFKTLAYKVHPYQWNTIGKDINILLANMEEVKRFFYQYYRPNAIWSVTGNINTEQTLSW